MASVIAEQFKIGTVKVIEIYVTNYVYEYKFYTWIKSYKLDKTVSRL